MKNVLINKNCNNNKGITLIALVITIIIMLIIAGVGVVTLTGENGILKRAQNAGDVSNEAHEKELLQAEVRSSYSRKGDLDIGTVNSNIKNNIKGITTDNAADFPLKVTYTSSGNIYKIDAQGNVTNSTIIKAGNIDLSTSSNLSTLYGETTDFTSVQGVNWQLFYDDTDNIYLIASDYVPGDTLPDELITEDQGTTYCRKFSRSAYGTGDIIPTSEPWKNASNASTVQNNPYLKYVGSTVNTRKIDINMKAVAYMLDTSRWSNYAGDVKGVTAIGGPTIEMFALSYNAKHNTNKMGTYDVVDSTNANEFGYKAKIGTGSWETAPYGLDASSDNMWVRTSLSKATGYWLASPSAGSYRGVCRVHYRGGVDYPFVHENYQGFRPIVIIPKSII